MSKSSSPRCQALLGALSLLFLGAEACAQESSVARPYRARHEQILRGIAQRAPWPCPEGWLFELGTPRRRAALLQERLLRSESWVEFLAYAVLLDWSPQAASETLDALVARLPEVDSPKVRQNLIFLVGLAAEDAGERLRAMRDDARLQDDDRVDAACALAMSGSDPAAQAWFEAEFPPSECMAGQPVFSFADYRRLEREGRREQLRSYRCWELLCRRSYFWRLGFLGHTDLFGLRRADRPEAEQRALVERLLPHFAEKWPGHPGSDDFCVHLSHVAAGAGDRLGAFRWAQRATLLPDQDVRGAMVRRLTALAESQLSLAELDALLASPDGRHNRDLLRATRFLALAREDRPAALAYFDALAAAEPSSVFAAARCSAAEQPVPAGLRSGRDEALTLELLVAFPRRSHELAQTPYQPPAVPAEERFLDVLSPREREVARRTRRIRHDSVTIDSWPLARQYRLLLELSVLEQAEAEALDPARRAELRYRQGALLYRNPDTFFPVWGSHTMGFGYALDAVRFDAEGDARLAAYAQRTFHFARAAACFASFAQDYPDSPLLDQALFSWAKSVARLMDYRPAKALDTWTLPSRPEEPGEGMIEYGHRRVAELFRTMLARCPDSPLAGDARAAAEYREARVLALRKQRARRSRSE